MLYSNFLCVYFHIFHFSMGVFCCTLILFITKWLSFYRVSVICLCVFKCLWWLLRSLVTHVWSLLTLVMDANWHPLCVILWPELWPAVSFMGNENYCVQCPVHSCLFTCSVLPHCSITGSLQYFIIVYKYDLITLRHYWFITVTLIG